MDKEPTYLKGIIKNIEFMTEEPSDEPWSVVDLNDIEPVTIEFKEPNVDLLAVLFGEFTKQYLDERACQRRILVDQMKWRRYGQQQQRQAPTAKRRKRV